MNMEDKLELKHLAPYLPYKLKVIDKHHEFCKKIINTQLQDNYKYKGIEPVELMELSSAIELSRRYIPLLHPLDRLTDKMIHDLAYTDKDRFIKEVKSRVISVVAWDDLLTNHYDVFDLIPKGLALPIDPK